MHSTTTFHLYFILRQKVVFQSGKCILLFCKLPFNEKNQKNNKKKWFWRALASILRVFAVLFSHKNDENKIVYELP